MATFSQSGFCRHFTQLALNYHLEKNNKLSQRSLLLAVIYVISCIINFRYLVQVTFDLSASFLDEKINLADSKWEDIHVATGALKMFFRELPEPLFTYAYFSDFFSAISKQKETNSVCLIKVLGICGNVFMYV